MNIERQAKLDAIQSVMFSLFDDMNKNFGGDRNWIIAYPEKFLSAIEQVEIDQEAIDAAQANRVKEFAE